MSVSIDGTARARPAREPPGRILQQLAYPRVLILDELGYLPLTREEASLFFRLLVRRYERASLIVTSNKSSWIGARSSTTRSWRPPILDRLLAFDVLYGRGRDLSRRPLSERRARLEDLLADGDMVHAVRRLAENGLEAWQQVLDRGYEGLVAKDEASPYEGGATRRRLKVKVSGWTDPEDRWRRVQDATR
jgi:IstB-like ATP binding protein/ATP dependent DNA ligase domain